MEINGYANYTIYDDGRIWSKARKNGKWLKPFPTHKGYLMVRLCDKGVDKCYSVHRLVAEHYIPNPENKPQVDHIDRNKLNNHVSNLRWVTNQENTDNRGWFKNNTSGHENICYDKSSGKWQFIYQKRGHRKYKRFKSKTDALCYKYIYLLRVQAIERGRVKQR